MTFTSSKSRDAVKTTLAITSFVAAGVVVGFANRSVVLPPQSPLLDISGHHLDLGAVWLQKEIHFELPLSNVSQADIAVAEVTTSCTCSGIMPQHFIVPAGDAQVLRGTIDLTRAVSLRAGDESAPFEVMIAAKTTPAGKLYQWRIHGVGRLGLHVEPVAIELTGAHEIVKGVSAPAIALSVNPRLAISDLCPQLASPIGTVAMTGPDDSGEYKLQFEPRNDLPVGKFASDIYLTSRLSNGGDGPHVRVPIRGIVTPPVRLAPSRISHVTRSPQNTSNRAHEIINILSNDKDKEWTLLETTAKPDWVTVTKEDSSHLRVHFGPGAKSAGKAKIGVLLGSGDGETVELELPVTIVGR